MGADGKQYRYHDLALMIRENCPEVIGAHIYVQLDALGLREVFDRGDTPCALPYSFTD